MPMMVDHARLFPLDKFQRVFFVYDDSQWHDWEFHNQSIFIHVRRQMKWWYMKRFLLPEMVRA